MVTIGIVGLDQWSTGAYADALVELEHEVVGADVSRRSRREFETQYAATTYDTLDEMYDSGLDGVVLTTPPKYHERAVLAAIERDLPAFIAKPLSNDLAGAERIVEAAAGSAADCVVGYPSIARTRYPILREYERQGRFGTVTHLEATYRRRRGIPARKYWQTSEKLAGGGVLMDLGADVLAFVLHFYGFPSLDRVMTVVRQEFENSRAEKEMTETEERTADVFGRGAEVFDVEDSVTALLQFEDGRSASVEVAWAANAEKTQEFLIRGQEAGATWRWGAQQRSLTIHDSRSVGADHFRTTEVRPREERHPNTNLMKKFVRCIRGDRPSTLIDAERALEIQRCLHEIYEASESSVGDGG